MGSGGLSPQNEKSNTANFVAVLKKKNKRKIDSLSSVAINTGRRETHQSRPSFVLASIVLTPQEKTKEEEESRPPRIYPFVPPGPGHEKF